MSKRYLYFSVIVLSLLLTSCGAKKTGTTGLRHATVNKVIKQYEKTAPEFETLYAHLRASYDDGSGSQSIGVSMRMQKGDTIWLSAKLAGLIPLAKLMITPNRVQFYEKINHQSFDGDFALLSNWLGMPVDFEKVQNLLLGQIVGPVDKQDFELKDGKNGYILSQLLTGMVQRSILIDKSTFKVKGQQIKRSAQREGVTIAYPSYQEKAGQLFPKMINIVVNHGNKSTKIDINYRSLELNRDLDFPFEMPSGYTEIELK